VESKGGGLSWRLECHRAAVLGRLGYRPELHASVAGCACALTCVTSPARCPVLLPAVTCVRLRYHVCLVLGCVPPLINIEESNLHPQIVSPHTCTDRRRCVAFFVAFLSCFRGRRLTRLGSGLPG
jgi:hypothetical protein